MRDFAPISHVTSSPSLVTVHPSLPVRSIKDLIALARARPGQLNYSAAGVGTNPHIAGKLFNLLARVNIVAVQFKGGGPADTATIAGEVGSTYLNEQLRKVLTAPGQAQLWQERGLKVVASSPAEFAAHLEREQAKWGKVIKEPGMVDARRSPAARAGTTSPRNSRATRRRRS